MQERKPVSAQINNRSRSALREGGWQTEQIQYSSEPMLILGTVGDQERGRLNASLRVTRKFDSETGNYVETGRDINLGNIVVQPTHRRRGIGSAMLAELDRQARLFGAEKISGKVNDSAEKETPGLLEFYRKNGFTVGKSGEGWEIVKILSHKALH
jgi:GNAT superfamily N-acetyltransferase